MMGDGKLTLDKGTHFLKFHAIQTQDIQTNVEKTENGS